MRETVRRVMASCWVGRDRVEKGPTDSAMARLRQEGGRERCPNSTGAKSNAANRGKLDDQEYRRKGAQRQRSVPSQDGKKN